MAPSMVSVPFIQKGPTPIQVHKHYGQYSTVLCSDVKCSKMQYSKGQYSALNYSTVQYITVHYSA